MRPGRHVEGGRPVERLASAALQHDSMSPRPRSIRCLAAAILAILTSTTCGEGAGGKPVVTIYTSIYENVIAELDPVLARQFPDVEVEWYQRGSEDVAARLNSEIAAGSISADLVMTSDPFWYQELKEAGYLLPYEAPEADRVPAELGDPDHAFVTVRVPLMVLAANTDRLTPDQYPASFADLTDPAWAGRITMGDPNRSGSMFTAVAALVRRYGWAYFEALRTNDIVAAGSNSTVLNRVMTGEQVVGIILLENLLRAKEQNPAVPLAIIYPADGSILVPSPIAILSTTREPDAARRIYSFFLSDAGQRALVGGWMYSPVATIGPPAGARAWTDIYAGQLTPWSPAYLRDTMSQRDQIKRRFTEIVLQ